MEKKEINIIIVGGTESEREDCLKDFFENFSEIKVSQVKEEDKKKKITLVIYSFEYQNYKINVYCDNKASYGKIKDQKEEKLINISLNSYMKGEYKFEIHLILILYNEDIKNQVKFFTDFAKGKYIFITQNLVPLDKYSCEDFSCSSFSEPESKVMIKNLLEEIMKVYPFYTEFKKYSKENYYNFLSYSQKYKLYSIMNEKALSELFNDFELFSFDAEDFSDDAIIIIQVLSYRKCKLEMLLKKLVCDVCSMTERISYYDKEKDKFICRPCKNDLKGE